jgi:hypothetical protein
VVAGVEAVEAVAATGAHPRPKDAQIQPAASKRSCLIVPPAYTRLGAIQQQKGVTVIEGLTTEKPDPTVASVLSIFIPSIFIPSITVTPFFGLAGREDDEDCGGMSVERQVGPD